MEEKSRLKWVDILKSFGIFAVAFGHIYRQENVLCWLYTFHVPLFFIAGGIVFRPSEILRNIKRRAFRILVPYAVFGVLMALYFSLIEYRWRDISMSLPDCLLGLVIGDMDHLEFHSHLWFLPCYFLTAVAYNALYRLLRPLGCRLVCAGACVVYMLFRCHRFPGGRTVRSGSSGCSPWEISLLKKVCSTGRRSSRRLYSSALRCCFSGSAWDLLRCISPGDLCGRSAQ